VNDDAALMVKEVALIVLILWKTHIDATWLGREIVRRAFRDAR